MKPLVITLLALTGIGILIIGLIIYHALRKELEELAPCFI